MRMGRHWAALAGGAAIIVMASPAYAQTSEYNIPAGPLKDALDAYGRQSGRPIIYRAEDVRDAKSSGFKGSATPPEALAAVLANTGFIARKGSSGAFAIVHAENSKTSDADGTTERPPFTVGGDRSEIEEIVVTGTLIKGATPASPVTVITREDIEKSAVGSLDEIIDRLPQNFGGGVSQDVNAFTFRGGAEANQSFGSGINLRGLGTEATLVLINGRRLAPSALGEATDISLIPLSIIERVEILNDGASAIYGSDAIAGVVNIITRKRAQGLESSVRVGTVTDGKKQEYQLSQFGGTDWGSGSAILNVEYNLREALSAADRSFARGAALPTDLLPHQESLGIYASINQDITELLTFAFDGIYTERNFNTSLTRGGFFSSNLDGGSEGINLAAALNLQVSEDWSLDFTGTYSQVSSISTINDLLGVMPPTRSIDDEYDLWSVEGTVNGSLVDLPGGTISLAAGAAYRQETYMLFEEMSSRNVSAVFFETRVPLFTAVNGRPGMRRLELSAAVRYEHFSDFGSTANPKFGAVWSPFEGLVFRGTFGRSFRAPTFRELSGSVNFLYGVVQPDPISPSGITAAIVRDGGNPDLSEERATSATFGFELQPTRLPGFRLTSSYFDIRYRDRVISPIGNGANPFTFLAAPEIFGDLITRSPSQASVDSLLANPNVQFIDFTETGFPFDSVGVIADFRNQNAANFVVQGVDVEVSYRQPLRSGVITASLNAAYMFRFEQQVTRRAPSQDLIDTVFNPTDLRIRSSFGWASGGFGADAHINYRDGYSDTVNPGCSPPGRSCPIKAWTTADLSISYDFPKNDRRLVFSNLRLTLEALNILDTDPPFVNDLATGFGFDPENADPLGRFVALRITKRW